MQEFIVVYIFNVTSLYKSIDFSGNQVYASQIAKTKINLIYLGNLSSEPFKLKKIVH